MPPYVVSRLALLQVCVVFFGVLFTATFMRMAQTIHQGRPMPVLLDRVQHYGVWLIVLPLAWTAAATLTVRELDQLPQIRPAWMIAGYILLATLAVLLLGTTFGAMAAALAPYDGPMQGG